MAKRGLDTVGKIARGLLDLFHYSDEPLEVIDPAKQLTNPNIRGQERELTYGSYLTPYGQEPKVMLQEYPDQSYFGNETYNPETGLGDFVHHTQQPSDVFYDLSEDIDKFFPIALEEIKDLSSKYGKELDPQTIMNLARSRAMKYAKDFGFLGLSNRKFRPNVYTSFEKIIPKDVSKADGSVGGLIEYLKKAGK